MFFYRKTFIVMVIKFQGVYYYSYGLTFKKNVKKKEEEEEEEKIRISGFRALESLSTEEMNLFILQGRAFRIRNAKWTV